MIKEYEQRNWDSIAHFWGYVVQKSLFEAPRRVNNEGHIL
jgi:hypothetical protein